MVLKKIQFRPGIARDITKYTDEGGWFDCDKIRFTDGFPEKIGGWIKNSTSQFVGYARDLHDWSSLDAEQYLSIGTTKKFYIDRGGTFYDITPLRKTTNPLPNDPVATTNGSAVITITDPAHGASTGDYVTLSGLTGPIGGVPAGDINIEHVILSTPTVNTYTVSVATTASATTTGGGAAGIAAYQITFSAASSTGLGWGAGAYSRKAWGDPADSGAASPGATPLWSTDNFGEDLAFNLRNNGIFFWDKSSGLATRAVAISALGGASDPPVVATEVMVSQNDRHLIAFGTNPIGSANQDQMEIRWSDSEDVTNWTPTATNSSGGIRLSAGSRIITARRSRNEIVIWTDKSLYSMQFSGGEFVFDFNLLSDRVAILGPNAAIAANNSLYWMDNRNFFIYNGSINILPCPVVNYVFDRINANYYDKIFAADVSIFNEVWWFYVSGDNTEPDSYVAYDYSENTWFIGSLARTAWTHPEFSSHPVAAGTDNYLYTQEYGYDADGASLAAYIESADFDIEDGQSLVFIRRFIPDVEFPVDVSGDPSVNLTVSVRDFPTDAYRVKLDSRMVDQDTTQIWMRARGRQAKIRWDSDGLGFKWRIGSPRLEVQQDGMR